MISIELGNGKTRFFRDVIEYLEYTENGFGDMIADDIGSFISNPNANLKKYEDEYLQIDVPDVDIPELPENFSPEE